MQLIGYYASPFARRVGVTLLMSVIIGFSTPAISDDWADAAEAYESRDYETALGLLTSLSEQGYAEAQFQLGFMYLQGLGTATDEPKAFEWYMASAQQGYAPAQFNVGSLFAIGVGVTKDDTKAVEWYGYAAEQKYPAAQHNLALMYKDGRGVSQDLILAYMWAELAVAQVGVWRQTRDDIRALLTDEQAQIASQMALEWAEAHQD